MNDPDKLSVPLLGVVMSNKHIYPKLEIPQTIDTGPRQGNKDIRVFAAFSNVSFANHIHTDVIIEKY